VTSKIRILVIDDEPTIRSVLRTSLEREYEVIEAATGREGLAKAGSEHPHFVILDLGLPDQPGFEVLKALRKWTTIPILILTVQDDESAKVALLDAGADDYLTKPFSVPELMARLRVGLRNHNLEEATPLFRSGDLVVELNQRIVTKAGELVKLTATEFLLLSLLVRQNGQVVSQTHLLREVWGKNALDQSHYLRIYIGQLRKKIETDPSSPRHILTEPGVGYKIE
jgi:two-component system KDP operon response regulator KdpE